MISKSKNLLSVFINVLTEKQDSPTVLEETYNESDNPGLPPPHLLHPSTLSEYKQVFITSRRKSGKERSNVKMWIQQCKNGNSNWTETKIFYEFVSANEKSLIFMTDYKSDWLTNRVRVFKNWALSIL